MSSGCFSEFPQNNAGTGGEVVPVVVSDLPIPIVQVIDESTANSNKEYPGGRVLIKWHLDEIKLANTVDRGLEISAFFLSVTGRVFAEQISSHLSFDVAPNNRQPASGEGNESFLRHQWVLKGPGKDEEDRQICSFSQAIDGLIPGEEYM